jgi:hypothetical protein
MFDIKLEAKESGLWVMDHKEVGKAEEDRDGMDGVLHKVTWLVRDHEAGNILRRNFDRRAILASPQPHYPVLVHADVIVGAKPKSRTLADVSSRNDVVEDLYIVSTRVETGTAIDSPAARLTNEQNKVAETKMLKERKDINVVVDGHHAVGFNTGFGWVGRGEFTVCGDQGIGVAADNLTDLTKLMEPVPYQNLSNFEAPANLAHEKFQGIVDMAIESFKRDGYSGSATLSMRKDNKDVVILSVRLTVIEPKFNPAF